MEGEQGPEHAKADEDEGEEDVLDIVGDVVVGRNLHHVHGRGTVEEVDAEDAEDEQGGASHEHQGELHGRILLLAATPNADEQVHGDEGNLVEHEHGEHIHADEEAEHARGKEREPEEVLLGERLKLPRSESAGEDDDARKQQHDNGNAIDADGVCYVEGLEPLDAVGEQHGVGVARMAGLDECQREPYGQCQQARRPGHHHAAHLVEVAGYPKAQQHQRGYYDE